MSGSDSILSLVAAIISLAVMLGVIAIPFVFMIGMYKRGGRVLARWAASNGYRIIESERRKVLKGPFFLTSSNNQMIYRVTVQDLYGNIRRGWVRCGSYNLGSWQEEVAVRWDS